MKYRSVLVQRHSYFVDFLILNILDLLTWTFFSRIKFEEGGYYTITPEKFLKFFHR